MSERTEHTIREIVERLLRSWLDGHFDELARFFHEDVVLAHPGFDRRTTGRDALVESYVDFGRNATVKHFETGDIQVDRAGHGFVAVTPWRMRYEYSGETFSERGWDILVFENSDSDWQIVWRTVILDDLPPGRA